MTSLVAKQAYLSGEIDGVEEYQFDSVSNTHNHEIDPSDLLLTRARESLKQQVVKDPFIRNNRDVYYTWYEQFQASLDEGEAAHFINIFPDYSDMKMQIWR